MIFIIAALLGGLGLGIGITGYYYERKLQRIIDHINKSNNNEEDN